MFAIEVKNLRKKYKFRNKVVNALGDVSFSVNEGEIFGLLGPNGAGKSTTINILSGLLEEDSGDVKILGKNVKEIKELMNVATAYAYLSGTLTIEQNLKVYAKLYNVKDKKRIDKLLKTFGIEHLKKKPVRTLSSGEKTRVNLCKGLINNPKVLLLDECTVGLDPDVAQKTRAIIKELKLKENTTILFTSHIMSEVEELCDRIAFLSEGKILHIGTPKELKSLIKIHTVEIDFFKPHKDLKNYFKDCKNILHIGDDKVICEFEHINDNLHSLVDKLIKDGFKIKDLNIRKPSLEDVFIKIARNEL